jgi:hypothetical protein
MKKTRPNNAHKQAAINARLSELSTLYHQQLATGDYAHALKSNLAAQALLPITAVVPSVWIDEGFCRLALGQAEAARTAYLRALPHMRTDPNLYDGLAHACASAGRTDEARMHGLKALELKNEETASISGLPLPALPPRDVQRERQVIAFSLFGALPKYCETAVINVAQARKWLPEWVCRFYLDASVPLEVRHRLQEAGADVRIVSETDQAKIPGIMWRFLVLDDPSVDRYLLRDSDSLISAREASAVQAWVDGGQHFHVMRDHFNHAELLLAGMWGGVGGVFSQVREHMGDYFARHAHLGRVVDQHFLRTYIWPTVRQSMLMHDSVFGFAGGVPFPPHPEHGFGPDFHVGCYQPGGTFASPHEGPDDSPVKWQMINAEGQVLATYTSTLRMGRWEAELPMASWNALKSGTLQVRVLS